MWMIKARPYSDETLSSYLVRTALLNYTTLHTLFSKSPHQKNYYKYDLDVFRFSNKFYEWLSEHTGLTLEKINQMHLDSYAGFLQEDVNSLSKQPWIISMGQRKGRGYRFCYQCLNEAAYYRKEWRALHINICEYHNNYLQNLCHKCQAQVIPQKLKENMKIWQCHQCGFDLRLREAENMKPDPRYILTQNKLCKIVHDGFYLVNGRPQYSIGFFNLLHHLVLYFMRKEKSTSKYRFYRKVSDVKPEKLVEYIQFSMNIFENWPFDFEHFCKKNRISNHFKIFAKAQWELFPYWFIDEMKRNIQKGLR